MNKSIGSLAKRRLSCVSHCLKSDTCDQHFERYSRVMDKVKCRAIQTLVVASLPDI